MGLQCTYLSPTLKKKKSHLHGANVHFTYMEYIAIKVLDLPRRRMRQIAMIAPQIE